mgnify:CR=1 FL=1
MANYNKVILVGNLTRDPELRYTPKGGRVFYSLKQSGNAAQLEISDTGIGIAGEALPFIFDRFFVVDKSRSKETGGSGLGLSIVKWIVDSHGARIEVESEEGKGSTFRFTARFYGPYTPFIDGSYDVPCIVWVD